MTTPPVHPARALVRRTHPRQSGENLALLNAVAQYGTAHYGLLFLMFGKTDLPDKQGHALFSKKLEHLCVSGQLAGTGRGQLRLFWLGDKVQGMGNGGQITHDPHAPACAADAAPAVRAAPRQNNTMTAPVYVPPPCAALRPGALDYQRYASFGHGC
ncbi:MAG: hypothetical protein PHH58_17655 [Rhodoferax sp.]|nr:hypothetical protein [Rhodoferax sp.]